MKRIPFAIAALALVLGTGILFGCGSDNPPPDPAASKAADEKRQNYIDSMPNLTPEQKAIMKSHMGGPPAPSPGGPGKSGRGN